MVEHPLARLRRLLGAAGLYCERLSPIEADGEHVLAAVSRVGADAARTLGVGGTKSAGPSHERAAARRCSVSFEFFPPADAAMEATLWSSVERLAPLAPRFVSVTYGADGSTRERTHNLVTRIQERDCAHRRAAPDLRRRQPRGDPRYCAQLLGRRGSVTWLRCAAIRRMDSAATRHIRTASPMPRTWSRDLRGSRPSRYPWRPTRRCTRRRASAERGSRESQAQDRRRRVARHHAILLRQRGVRALPRSLCRRRHRRADRAGDSADHALSAGAAVCAGLRRGIPRWLHERFSGLEEDPETRRLIAASVAIEQVQALHAPRRARVPFLHAESR